MPSHQRYLDLCYLGGRLCILCWRILDTFHLVLLSGGLTVNSTCWNWLFCFPEEVHNRGLPSNPTICTPSLSLDEDQSLVWLVVVQFACPMISFVSQYSHFIAHNNLLLKQTIILHLSRERHVEIWSTLFFVLTYMELKHQSK